MNTTDLVLYFLPIAITVVLMVFVVRKTGAFDQRQHRKKVEELLERIALAVENKR
jgi:low affinity Fe/Cu permease